MTQATITSFGPIDPVWLEVQALKGHIPDDKFQELKLIRKQRGERPMVKHICRYQRRGGPKPPGDEGPEILVSVCGAKHLTWCNSQHWPWYLCPYYQERNDDK